MWESATPVDGNCRPVIAIGRYNHDRAHTHSFGLKCDPMVRTTFIIERKGGKSQTKPTTKSNKNSNSNFVCAEKWKKNLEKNALILIHLFIRVKSRNLKHLTGE